MVDNGGAFNFWAHSATVNPTTLAISIMANTYITGNVNLQISIGYNQAVNRVATQSFYNNNGDNVLTSLALNSNGTLNYNGNELSLGASTINNGLFVYEPTQQRLIFIATPSSNSYYPTAYPIIFSGGGNTLMSFGSTPTIQSSIAFGGVLEASAIGSSQISVFTNTSGGTGRFVIGTVSGSSVSFGGFNTTGLTGYSGAGSIAITGTSTYAVQSGPAYQTYTLSGSTATFGSVRALSGGSPSSVWFISSAGEVNYFVYATSPTINDYLYSPYNTNITASNFIGFSAGTYTNGTTATVNTVGSTDNNQNGLTAGTKYYVGVTGALNTTSSNPYAGVALSGTKLLIKG